ncbi:DUF2844 domain-containing protein [Paraburkholderia ferrariae]|uniref:DUF2844 domain-containing protein n=1 Tax=Paraburkholderia ferrariae TaxID=386056 RepID=UPI00048252A1|nr:DUF2844 domain-containing protein [Paraburkholderia ferrariae]
MTTRPFLRAGRLAACASLLAASLGAAAPAQAALGDTATPVAGATTRTIAGGTASVVSYVDAGGTTIDTYVARANGEIFAYAWHGPTMPNLAALLGRYAASWRSGASAALDAARGDLHSARVDQPDVVVETGGQMRSYVGRAWLPAALPAGVSEGDLR